MLCVLFIQTSHAQESERSADFWGLGFAYGVDFSAGDMADRYGQHSHASLSFDLFKNKFNGILRLEASLSFGSNVKEDVLSIYRAENGALLGNDGQYVDVFLRQRGSYLGVLAEKIILSKKDNKRAGLSLGLGLGLMQHNIRFQVDSSNAPQLEGDYAKGYDRNSIGPAIKQNISYLHLGKNKSLNYQISLFFTEAFTQNNRSINFDTMAAEEGRRLDIVIGLEARWIIPFKDQQKAEEIFY